MCLLLEGISLLLDIIGWGFLSAWEIRDRQRRVDVLGAKIGQNSRRYR